MIANVIKKICTEDIDNVEAFLACRLIPLDKNPGLRPIGVGEVIRRIAGKVVMRAVKDEVMDSVGSLQTCAGQEGGIEATIHAMRELYSEDSTEAVLLVDASNAFNSVNRQTFLHNINIICPVLAKFVRNCYSHNARLFIVGGGEIRSNEGTTQGDPAAMAIYAIAIIPLILMLVDMSKNRSKTVGYADDIAAAGKLNHLKTWWETLCELGPKFGYFPESSKSWLIVKKEYHTTAINMFIGSNINVTIEGRRYLGGTIGTNEFKSSYIENKINDLKKQLCRLSEIAMYEPQAAYAAFTFGFKHKITHLLRTIPDITEHISSLDETIDDTFIPAITGGITCSEIERRMLALPAKLGGLGIPIFSSMSTFEYNYSLKITSGLKCNIKDQVRKLNPYHETKKKKQEIKAEKSRKKKNDLAQIRCNMSIQQENLNELASEKHASLWLTTLPIKGEGYMLTKQQFWDLIRIRYGWQLKRLPTNCECGANFNLEHALSCKKGGFVSLRHNHLRNVTAKMLNEVCKDVKVEPILQPMTGENLPSSSNISDEARLDIAARGFWEAHQKAFFDIRVYNPMAKRYATQSLRKAFECNEREKKRNYNERVMQIEHGTFSPLVFAATGGLGRECEKFYDRLAAMISEKRNDSYNRVITWVRRKIIFSLINSVCVCLRGSRTANHSYHGLASSIQDDVSSSEQRST
jgi:hypothetical protein